MTDATRVDLRRRIAAPAHKVFGIVCDPKMHVEIDGSGMLLAAPDAKQLAAVGDTFEMNMDREPLGDFPEMGKYQVLNTVTKIVPDQTLEWNVGSREHGAFGHVYGYELVAVNGDATDVTLYCDWSAIPESVRDLVKWPVVPVHMLEKSLDNLDRIATAAS